MNVLRCSSCVGKSANLRNLLSCESLWAASTSVRTKMRPRKQRNYYGIYKTEGHTAHKDDLLVVQRFHNYHPGLNVRLEMFSREKRLRAMCTGKVMITRELCNPDYSNPIVEQLYGERKEVPLYKFTFNVVPDPQIGSFRLVEQI